MLKNHILNKINIVIAVVGFFLSIFYYAAYDNFMSPFLMTIITITLHTIYSFKYKTYDKTPKEFSKIYAPPQGKSKADICVEDIKKTIDLIMEDSKDKKNLLLVTDFFKNIKEIEDTVKKIHDNYKNSKNFIDTNRNIVTEDELQMLEKKIGESNGNKKLMYQKIYDKKKKTFGEIESIQESLVDNLLNLQYILSNLQQIQVTINSVSISNESDDRDIREVGVSIETFSEELKGSLNRMKI